MRMGRLLFFQLLFLFIVSNHVFAQHIVNNGNGIVVNSGAYLVIGGDYINYNGGQDAFVDLDGNMHVYQNFMNYADNEVFVNIEPVPDGTVLMPSAQQQIIGGDHETQFENLTVSSSMKVLDVYSASVSGVFSLAAVFDLNSNILEIEKNNTTALVYNSGYLFAETDPIQGLGILRWFIDDNIADYYIPFGSGQANYNDLDLVFSVQSAATGNGYVDFSTYPTAAANVPLPDMVSTLTPYDAELTINRFWLMDVSHTNKPDVEIQFSYTQIDCYGIKESTLKAVRFNDNQSVWDDWGPFGSININSNTLLTPLVSESNLFKNWTLTGEINQDFIFIPNTFSPNGDGQNDFFFPIIGNEEVLDAYMFRIFDRWGSEIFFTKDINEGWSGLYKEAECQQDVYVYILEYIDVTGTLQHKYGNVNLIR